MIIGQRLPAARLFAGYTQVRLAESIDMSFQGIQRYETAQIRIPIDILLHCARVLGVSYVYFFRDIETNPENSALQHVRRQMVDMVHSFMTIRSADVRQQLLDLARVFARTEQGDRTDPTKPGSSPKDDASK